MNKTHKTRMFASEAAYKHLTRVQRRPPTVDALRGVHESAPAHGVQAEERDDADDCERTVGNAKADVTDLIPGRYVAAIWFASGPVGDFAATAYRDKGGPWVVSYRFRWAGSDEKSPYIATYPDFTITEDRIVAMGDALARDAQESMGPGAKLTKVPIASDDPARALELLSVHDFVHITPEGTS